MDDSNKMPDIELPEDLTPKLKEIKTKIEKFKNRILKEFPNKVLGVAILPPPKDPKADKNKYYLFTLFANPQEKKDFYSFITKADKQARKIASEIDPKIDSEVMLLSELKESCLDGKYEILQEIAVSAILHDKGILSALKLAEIHKGMVLKKFEKYVTSYIGFGGLFRDDAKANDIDIGIIIDDTDVKRMSRYELRDKLRNIIINLGYNASDLLGMKDAAFHIQVYILTDFWESVKDAQPVIFTLLRDGVPLFDRGIFMPWKLLLQMGRIRPSPESIDMQMDVGDKLIDRAKKKFVGILLDDLFFAILNPAQAALMLYGLNPPTHRETVKLVNDIFVKKEKLLEAKYALILEKAFKTYKDIEHGKIKDVTGTELDKRIKEAEMYLKRIQKLFDQINKKQESSSLKEAYADSIKIVQDVVENPKAKNIVLEFKKYVDKNKLPEQLLTQFKDILNIKKNQSKLTKAEIEKVKRESRTFIRILLEHIQRKKLLELEKAKIRFKYENKIGEVIILEKVALLISDLDAKEKEYLKANITKNGALSEFKKIEAVEFEETITKAEIPQKIFVNESIFESLRKHFGKNIEISVNY